MIRVERSSKDDRFLGPDISPCLYVINFMSLYVWTMHLIRDVTHKSVFLVKMIFRCTINISR